MQYFTGIPVSFKYSNNLKTEALEIPNLAANSSGVPVAFKRINKSALSIKFWISIYFFIGYLYSFLSHKNILWLIIFGKNRKKQTFAEKQTSFPPHLTQNHLNRKMMPPYKP